MGMTRTDIAALMKGLAPVLAQYVDERLAPLDQRLDVLEAQSGIVKRLPVYRVPAIRGEVR